MQRHRPSPFQLRPELSQHFFRDPALARRIVDALPIATGVVLEIGSGTGLLTEALADRGFRVIAIEKDARLFRSLRARMIGRTNVECHHSDFRDAPLPRGPYTVVANLPFGITADTIRRLTGGEYPPRDAFLVVQLEAAQKFTGVPRESLFSLLLKPSFEASILRLLRRVDFDPPPRVRPALLHLHRRPRPLLSPRSDAPYRRFVTATFGAAPLAGQALRRHLTRTQVLRLARDLAFSTSSRVTELTFPQWLAIFRFYENVCLGRDPTLTNARIVAHTTAAPTLSFAPFAPLG